MMMNYNTLITVAFDKNTRLTQSPKSSLRAVLLQRTLWTKLQAKFAASTNVEHDALQPVLTAEDVQPTPVRRSSSSSSSSSARPATAGDASLSELAARVEADNAPPTVYDQADIATQRKQQQQQQYPPPRQYTVMAVDEEADLFPSSDEEDSIDDGTRPMQPLQRTNNHQNHHHHHHQQQQQQQQHRPRHARPAPSCRIRRNSVDRGVRMAQPATPQRTSHNKTSHQQQQQQRWRLARQRVQVTAASAPAPATVSGKGHHHASAFQAFKGAPLSKRAHSNEPMASNWRQYRQRASSTPGLSSSSPSSSPALQRSLSCGPSHHRHRSQYSHQQRHRHRILATAT